MFPYHPAVPYSEWFLVPWKLRGPHSVNPQSKFYPQLITCAGMCVNTLCLFTCVCVWYADICLKYNPNIQTLIFSLTHTHTFLTLNTETSYRPAPSPSSCLSSLAPLFPLISVCCVLICEVCLHMWTCVCVYAMRRNVCVWALRSFKCSSILCKQRDPENVTTCLFYLFTISQLCHLIVIAWFLCIMIIIIRKCGAEQGCNGTVIWMVIVGETVSSFTTRGCWSPLYQYRVGCLEPTIQ